MSLSQRILGNLLISDLHLPFHARKMHNSEGALKNVGTHCLKGMTLLERSQRGTKQQVSGSGPVGFVKVEKMMVADIQLVMER